MYFTICTGLLEADMTQSEIDRPDVRYLYQSPAFDAMKLQIGDGWVLAMKKHLNKNT